MLKSRRTSDRVIFDDARCTLHRDARRCKRLGGRSEQRGFLLRLDGSTQLNSALAEKVQVVELEADSRIYQMLLVHVHDKRRPTIRRVGEESGRVTVSLI